MADPTGAGGAGGGGNTKTPPLKSSKHRSYCLTLNNYTDEELEHWNTLFAEGKRWIIGKEIGEEKTPHLQAYIQYKSSRSFGKMKKLFPRAHIEQAKGSPEENWKYCKKDGNFTTNMDFEEHRAKLRRLCLIEYETVVWLPWQQRVLDIIESNHICDRKIFWYWEKVGNIGKTFLCKYIACKYDVIICDGKKDNIFNQVNTLIENGGVPRIILLDIPRSNIDYINYGAIEQLKNGMMYSGKYEGGICIFPTPHVIAFANECPDITAMSKDRWVIEQLED